MQRWGQGLPLGSGDGDWGPHTGRENTVAPGYRGHPRRSDLVRAERGNPVEVRACPVSRPQGRPNSYRRERMVRQANAGGSKGHRKPGHQLLPSAAAPHNWPDTGGCLARKGADADQVSH